MLSVELDNSKSHFSPGESISGTAKWNLSGECGDAEVHLLWYTEGKGTRDADILESLTKPNSSNVGELKFHWKLPHSPYSYSGKLLSILWKVELIIDGVDEIGEASFTLTPNAGSFSSMPREEEVQGKEGWFPRDF